MAREIEDEVVGQFPVREVLAGVVVAAAVG
jgi:hypothetical protein